MAGDIKATISKALEEIKKWIPQEYQERFT